jgi:hypothetical protein
MDSVGAPDACVNVRCCHNGFATACDALLRPRPWLASASDNTVCRAAGASAAAGSAPSAVGESSSFCRYSAAKRPLCDDRILWQLVWGGVQASGCVWLDSAIWPPRPTIRASSCSHDVLQALPSTRMSAHRKRSSQPGQQHHGLRSVNMFRSTGAPFTGQGIMRAVSPSVTGCPLSGSKSDACLVCREG